MGMRVAVTGGTGFIGKALVASLLARGDEVLVLTRSPEKAAKSFASSSRLSFAAWDAAREPATWVEGVDAIVHLAGEGVFDARWSDARKKALVDSRVVGTKAIAEAIRAAAHKPRVWLSASAIGYYGQDSSRPPQTEAGAPGSDFLADLARAWEDAAAPAKGLGVRVVHPRIGLVLGAQGGALAEMLPPFRLGVGGPLGSGKQAFPWIHLGDAVAALVFLLDTPSIEGPVNLVAPALDTMGTFAKALGRGLRRPAVFAVPGFALAAVLGAERAKALLEGVPVLPEKLQANGFRYRFPEVGAALADILA
jgi:uncharacterized protein (TIGR01777 family)